MAGLASFLKQSVAGATAPSAAPTSPDAANPAAAAAASLPATSSKFSLPGFSIPGITLPGLGMGIIPTGIDSTHNNNPLRKGLYPASATHPKYSVPEASLLGAMHFPKTWTNAAGNKKPVILVPGTGSYGGTAFRNNFAKLLTDWELTDPMWLNIPGAMCDESPKNAEYVAYAIHYVAGLTVKNVTVIAWSQGNLACQWSFKYWPSTRTFTENMISISADFHGTLTAYVSPLNAPSIFHQRYYSDFIRTLRANGGDSAYVPTTSIYSSLFDEVVQPQAGAGASAFMNDARGKGVLNVDLQQICPFTPAGSFFGHAGVLYNGLAWALAKDAITHGKVASLDRINLPAVSMQLMAPGLTVLDVDATVAVIPVCGANILGYLKKVIWEPKLPAYCAAETAALPPAPVLTAEQKAIVDKSKQAGTSGLPTVVDPSLPAAAALGQSGIAA